MIPELANRNAGNYEGVWRRHLSDRIGADLAIDVRPRHIKALRGDMLAQGLGAQPHARPSRSWYTPSRTP